MYRKCRVWEELFLDRAVFTWIDALKLCDCAVCRIPPTLDEFATLPHRFPSNQDLLPSAQIDPKLTVYSEGTGICCKEARTIQF